MIVSIAITSTPTYRNRVTIPLHRWGKLNILDFPLCCKLPSSSSGSSIWGSGEKRTNSASTTSDTMITTYGTMDLEAKKSSSAAFCTASIVCNFASSRSISFSMIDPRISGLIAPATLLQIPMILTRWAALSAGPSSIT